MAWDWPTTWCCWWQASDGPIWLELAHQVQMRWQTRLSYGPTLFEASMMAVWQLLTLAHIMNLLPLADKFELAHGSPWKPYASPKWAYCMHNHIWNKWLTFAHQAQNSLLHGTIVSPHIICSWHDSCQGLRYEGAALCRQAQAVPQLQKGRQNEHIT